MCSEVAEIDQVEQWQGLAIAATSENTSYIYP